MRLQRELYECCKCGDARGVRTRRSLQSKPQSVFLPHPQPRAAGLSRSALTPDFFGSEKVVAPEGGLKLSVGTQVAHTPGAPSALSSRPTCQRRTGAPATTLPGRARRRSSTSTVATTPAWTCKHRSLCAWRCLVGHPALTLLRWLSVCQVHVGSISSRGHVRHRTHDVFA